MRGGIELSIVIPAYNEEASVAQVVLEHDAEARRLGPSYEILVLDDGSTDATRATLERLRADVPALAVLSHARNQGITRSILDLYAGATGSWIYVVSADGQIAASALSRLWATRAGHQVVVGWRHARRDTGRRRLLSRLFSLVVRRLFGLRVQDPGSVKLYEATWLRRAWPRSRSVFAEAEILIRVSRAGGRIAEVPIEHRPRRGGRSRGARPGVLAAAIVDLVSFCLGGGRRG